MPGAKLFYVSDHEKKYFSFSHVSFQGSFFVYVDSYFFILVHVHFHCGIIQID